MPPRVTKIVEIANETPIHKTFYFKDKPCQSGEPGQFVMIWIPGVDEIPMSLSEMGDLQAVTIEKVGDATKHIFEMKSGDLIGIRGPYGNGFSTAGQNPLFIAGGSGIIPLYPLIKKLGKGHVILGAKTASTLLFKENILKTGLPLTISTDDGSEGYHGTVIDVAEKILQEKKNDMAFTCGPEKMMKKAVDLARQFSVPLEASLERWMKCGIGICDSCAASGFHVCKDGPVFTGQMLQKFTEFGKWHRLPSGKRAFFQ